MPLPRESGQRDYAGATTNSTTHAARHGQIYAHTHWYARYAVCAKVLHSSAFHSHFTHEENNIMVVSQTGLKLSSCMKAVNQSIGRSIRHVRDYACIVLADQRYSRPSVHSKLPQWISSQLVVCQSFGPAFSSLRKVSWYVVIAQLYIKLLLLYVWFLVLQ